MNKVTVIDHNEFGLEEKDANKISSGLNIILEERKVLEDAYIDIIDLEITEETIPEFKALRLKIVKNRTQGIEDWHTSNKAFYLSGGRFVDSIKNKEILVNKQMESKLLEAEKYFENIEKERVRILQEERVLLLSKYVDNAHERELSSMDEDIWDSFLATKKQNHEDIVKAEKKREEERIKLARIEAKKIEAQIIENAKLKAEAEKREADILKERKAAEVKLEKQRKEAKVKADKIEAENKALLEKERKEKEKLEKELNAKRQKEQRDLNNKKAADAKLKAEAEKRAKAPVQEKLNLWVDGFNIDIPSSELLNNKKALLIKNKFDSFKKWAKSEIENL